MIGRMEKSSGSVHVRPVTSEENYRGQRYRVQAHDVPALSVFGYQLRRKPYFFSFDRFKCSSSRGMISTKLQGL